MDADTIRAVGRAGWNRFVAEGTVWTIPVVPAPTKPVPADWSGDIRDQAVLCSASPDKPISAPFPLCIATRAVKP